MAKLYGPCFWISVFGASTTLWLCEINFRLVLRVANKINWNIFWHRIFKHKLNLIKNVAAQWCVVKQMDLNRMSWKLQSSVCEYIYHFSFHVLLLFPFQTYLDVLSFVFAEYFCDVGFFWKSCNSANKDDHTCKALLSFFHSLVTWLEKSQSLQLAATEPI